MLGVDCKLSEHPRGNEVGMTMLQPVLLLVLIPNAGGRRIPAVPPKQCAEVRDLEEHGSAPLRGRMIPFRAPTFKPVEELKQRTSPAIVAQCRLSSSPIKTTQFVRPAQHTDRLLTNRTVNITH
jgi:hypothetical protein